MFVDFNILNQLGSPSINSNTFANRPAAGQTGRLFVSTDTFEIYRDNGTTWDLIGGPGSSTITGTGTATQVAYFTSSQAIGSSSNLYWDNTNIRLGIGTSTPGTRLDIHGTGIMQHINATGATANSLMAFQRTGTNVWRLGDQYNGGNNYFELHNTVLNNNAIQVLASSNEATFLSSKTYSTGNAIGVAVQHNLTIPNGVNVGLAALGGVNSNLNLSLGGSTTVANTGRQGLEGSTTIGFTGAGTLTMTQGSTVRAFSALSSVYAFNGSAVGTITHLAGLRICFPDNVGSAVNITNNYALLINNQTTGTGTVTYTNRWGIYQEGASDLNYMAANLLLGSTVNNGNRLQVTGNGNLTGDMTADAYYLNGMTAGNGALYWTSDRVTLANYNSNGVLHFEVNGGAFAAMFDASGNLGLGVIPVASTIPYFDGGSNLIISGRGNSYINNNVVFDGAFKYIVNGTAAQYNISGAEHRWLNAPSGTAGTAISFTQAMTLDASGNLGIGSTNQTARLTIKGPTNATANQQLNFEYHSNTTKYFAIGLQDATGNGQLLAGTGNSLIFYTNSDLVSTNERMRITSGGNVLIGTTTDNSYKLVSNGTTYGGQTLEVSPGYGNTDGQLSFAVATWGNVSSTTIDLSTLLPRVTLTTRGIFVTLSIITQASSTDTTVYTVQAIRTINGTWTFNTLGSSGTFTLTFSGTGTTITITFSSGAQFGKAAIQFINQS